MRDLSVCMSNDDFCPKCGSRVVNSNCSNRECPNPGIIPEDVDGTDSRTILDHWGYSQNTAYESYRHMILDNIMHREIKPFLGSSANCDYVDGFDKPKSKERARGICRALDAKGEAGRWSAGSPENLAADSEYIRSKYLDG